MQRTYLMTISAFATLSLMVGCATSGARGGRELPPSAEKADAILQVSGIT